MSPSDFEEFDTERDAAHDAEDRLAAVPAYQAGGRVERTGIALVHEGEYIVPAAGSEAVVSPADAPAAAGQVINYYFPVEVDVVGELSETQMERIAQYVFDELQTALRSQG